jgi:hypothetical protein
LPERVLMRARSPPGRIVLRLPRRLDRRHRRLSGRTYHPRSRPPSRARYRRARPTPCGAPDADHPARPSKHQNQSVAPPEPMGSAMASSLHPTHQAEYRRWTYGEAMSRRTLVAISSTQLLAGTVGQLLALQRGLAFNIALIGWKGRSDRVATDSWLRRAAISHACPIAVVCGQAWLSRRWDRSPTTGLLVGRADASPWGQSPTTALLARPTAQRGDVLTEMSRNTARHEAGSLLCVIG